MTKFSSISVLGDFMFMKSNSHLALVLSSIKNTQKISQGRFYFLEKSQSTDYNFKTQYQPVM